MNRLSTGGAPTGASPDPLESLENDRAALHNALTLILSHPDRSILGNDGDPDAVIAWLQARRAEVENTIDAALGCAPPCAVVVIEVSGGIADVAECPPGIEVRIIDRDNEAVGEGGGK